MTTDDGDPTSRERKRAIRENLSILRAAVTHGWDVPPEAMRRAVDEAIGTLDHPGASTRDKHRAIDILRLMRKDDIEARTALDRIERLEVGESTDNITFRPIEF